MMYWGGDMGGWGYALTVLSFVLFWGAIITSIILWARSIGGGGRRYGGGTAGPDTAESLLAERFARGEIDESEYTARLTVLRRGRAGAR